MTTAISSLSNSVKAQLRGLRGAIVFAMVIGFMIPAVATFVIEQSISMRAARIELDRDLERTTRTLALALQGQLWELAQENAYGIVKAISDDARFDSVVVYDFASKHKFVELIRHEKSGGELRSAEHLIEQDGAPIGKVVLTMRLDPYLAVIRTSQSWMMLRTILTLLTSLAFIVLVLHKRILKPITALTERAQLLAQEDFSQAIELDHQDELGQVANSMERMRQALVRAFSELHSKNEELTLYAASLEQRVRERTEALIYANAELTTTLNTLQATQAGLIESEKLASLGRLVAGVAHELNTPLGNAITVITTLEDHAEEFEKTLNSSTLRRSDLNEFLTATVEGQGLLHRNIARAADLVRDFKQLAIDQTTDMRRDFDLSDVIREVLLTIQPLFKPTPFNVNTDLAEDVHMDSYPGPLGQVLTNLLINALIHGFEDLQQGTITVKTSLRDSKLVRITVTDNGHGMTPETAKRVFEPFFTTKLGQGGSGLGLHIVHNIVIGLLGGKIEVSSQLNQGCQFEVMLPLSAPKHAPAESSGDNTV